MDVSGDVGMSPGKNADEDASEVVDEEVGVDGS